MKKLSRSFIINFVNRAVIFIVIITAFAIIGNNIARIRLTTAMSNRHDLTNYANQFMDASSYLTNEVRAFSATGNIENYNNYFREVEETKRRQNSIKMMEKIGITQEERALITRMMEQSDALIPLELEAMEKAKNGDFDGALNIVYGSYYNARIAQIATVKNEFLLKTEQRTTNIVTKASRAYDILNAITWIMILITAISQIIQKNELHRLAYKDTLTGGLNYTAFREYMRSSNLSGRKGYVISIDLRGFATINDACGVQKGDLVIKSMHEILLKHTKKGELLAHVLGDRFVQFLHADSDEILIDRLRVIHDEIKDLSLKLDIPNVTPKFGISPAKNTHDPEQSYGEANLAKQQLKVKSGYFFMFFDEKIKNELLAERNYEDRFPIAIKEHQFKMWYQPKFDPKTNLIVSSEALVRWVDSDGSIIPPLNFIPLYERNGMITQLDEYIFEEVCMSIRSWLDSNLKIVPVAINVSRASLYFSDIANRYHEIIQKYQIPIDLVELEITERSVASDENLSETINKLRSFGFKILIDDFGSGYSSLSLLTKDYFSNIKLDKSLIDCIGTKAGNSLLESLVVLAHKFNITVTAEGVETVEQVDFLKNICCDNIQGYYYSRPLKSFDYIKLLGSNIVQG